jgi:LPXTG-site transpeptidase (sortase) family protein
MVRQNSVFYLLGELKTDDFVFIGFNGEIYKYKVYDQKIVGANDIEYLDYKEEGREVLILQTCWPIGTDWKRLLIFAGRI